MATINIPLADLEKVVYGSNEPTIVNFGVCTWAKPYTLTVPAKPTGVASCTVSRTSTKSSIGTTGTIATAGSSAQSITIYHGDVISISATAASGYTAPTASLSETTVSGNVTATIKAGSVAAKWRTVFTGSYTPGEWDECGNEISPEVDTRLILYATKSNTNVSKTVSGIRSGVPTKATFSGQINRSDGAYHTINQRTLAESSTGVYTGSGSYPTGTGKFGFTLTMNTNSVAFKAYTSGTIDWEDECGETWTTSVYFTNATVYVTEIQQYY